MNAIGRLWMRLKRFRHRRGYGVHSPFAFDFLTFVVYERGEYYAYRDLTGRHPVSVFQRNGHLVKCRKFLFRLANYVHPAVIRLVGNVEAAEADYLSAGCQSADVVCARPDATGRTVAEGAARKGELRMSRSPNGRLGPPVRHRKARPVSLWGHTVRRKAGGLGKT